MLHDFVVAWSLCRRRGGSKTIMGRKLIQKTVILITAFSVSPRASATPCTRLSKYVYDIPRIVHRLTGQCAATLEHFKSEDSPTVKGLVTSASGSIATMRTQSAHGLALLCA
jgi:hypothetical protein